MIFLCVDTCTTSCSAALADEKSLIASAFCNTGRVHSTVILPQIDACLKAGGKAVSELDYLAVTVGPGSFTGVRIGVATAKGLSQPHGLPIIPVSTLEALAGGLSTLPGTRIATALNARRGQIYFALFEQTAAGLQRITPDAVLSAEEAHAQMEQSPLPRLITGDGAELLFDPSDPLDFLAPPELRLCRAEGVAAAARQALSSCLFTPVSCRDLTPVYLRRPQAERERLERLKKEDSQ